VKTPLEIRRFKALTFRPAYRLNIIYVIRLERLLTFREPSPPIFRETRTVILKEMRPGKCLLIRKQCALSLSI